TQPPATVPRRCACRAPPAPPFHRPACRCPPAVLRHGGTALRETRVGEDQHGDAARLQDAAERAHGRPEFGRVYEDVVADHQVELVILAGRELGAGVHPEVDAGVVGPRDLDHPLGEVHAGDTGAAVAELPRQVPRAAAGVEHGEPAYVARELPQDGVGVEPPVAVPIVADLNAPAVGEQVPALAGFLQRAIAHQTFSRLGIFTWQQVGRLCDPAGNEDLHALRRFPLRERYCSVRGGTERFALRLDTQFTRPTLLEGVAVLGEVEHAEQALA